MSIPNASMDITVGQLAFISVLAMVIITLIAPVALYICKRLGQNRCGKLGNRNDLRSADDDETTPKGKVERDNVDVHEQPKEKVGRGAVDGNEWDDVDEHKRHNPKIDCGASVKQCCTEVFRKLPCCGDCN